MSTNAVDALSSLGLGATSKTKKPELGQADFLKLMVSQLQNQNPLKPLENSEFLGQLAQFSTVSGIQDMQSSLSALSSSLQASQALQGTSLIGRHALVEGDVLGLGASDGATGAVDLASSSRDVVVEIRDAAGQVVRTLDLGTQPAGLASFEWDGLDNAGNRAGAGDYQVKAIAVTGEGAAAATTLVGAEVQTVSLGGSAGLVLNLAGVGATPLSAVRQLY